ncbi:hypothetical protein DFH08DRAFT_970760 [Mycena albidolilacea]|uniref:Uncharacterized protein n=1 Tax=Mycena albidolilacea TaxID=1033008 RepID=A0AAD6ZEN1_9AGAR|nr:hypothetical protein DFH08DRAFT_970760 [Mycena albidolilacea]
MDKFYSISSFSTPEDTVLPRPDPDIHRTSSDPFLLVIRRTSSVRPNLILDLRLFLPGLPCTSPNGLFLTGVASRVPLPPLPAAFSFYFRGHSPSDGLGSGYGYERSLSGIHFPRSLILRVHTSRWGGWWEVRVSSLLGGDIAGVRVRARPPGSAAVHFANPLSGFDLARRASVLRRAMAKKIEWASGVPQVPPALVYSRVYPYFGHRPLRPLFVPVPYGTRM